MNTILSMQEVALVVYIMQFKIFQSVDQRRGSARLEQNKKVGGGRVQLNC